MAPHSRVLRSGWMARLALTAVEIAVDAVVLVNLADVSVGLRIGDLLGEQVGVAGARLAEPARRGARPGVVARQRGVDAALELLECLAAVVGPELDADCRAEQVGIGRLGFVEGPGDPPRRAGHDL